MQELQICCSQLFSMKDTKTPLDCIFCDDKEQIRCVIHCSFVLNILEGWVVIDTDAPQCS